MTNLKITNNNTIQEFILDVVSNKMTDELWEMTEGLYDFVHFHIMGDERTRLIFDMMEDEENGYRYVMEFDRNAIIALEEDEELVTCMTGFLAVIAANEGSTIYTESIFEEDNKINGFLNVFVNNGEDVERLEEEEIIELIQDQEHLVSILFDDVELLYTGEKSFEKVEE